MLTRKKIESVPAIRYRIEIAEKELEELELDPPCDIKALGLSFNQQHSSYPIGIDEAMARYLDEIERRQKSLLSRKRYLMGLLKEIDQLLEKIEDENAKMVIEMHCIQGCTFREIAEASHLSHSVAHRIYSHALQAMGIR